MKSEKSLLYLIAFVAIFSYLFGFYVINLSLHHYYQQIAWQNNDLFLKYYLAFSGGPAEYLALFISQFFGSNFLGSIIITASGILISFFLFKTIYLRWGKYNLMFLLVPLVQIILLALMCDYKYQFSVTVNLIIVSGFLFLCTVIKKRAGFTFSYHTIILGILLYYISGGIYFLIFMVSSILLLFEKPNRRMFFNAFLILTTTLVIPYFAHQFVFLSSLNNSFFRSTPDVAVMLRYSRPLLFYIGLAIIPVVIFLNGISAITLIPKKKAESLKVNAVHSKHKKHGGLKLKINNRKIGVAVQLFVLTVASGIILYMVYNPVEKAKVEIDYYAGHQNWENVLTMSGKVVTYDRMVNFQYNRALVNTGQLLEKLFYIEQSFGSQGLFLDRPFAAEVALPNSDIYFDLGNIDESQRYAFESETLMKVSPRVLKRLILNCIIMNKIEAAHTYINILAANPLEKKWVEKYSGFISNPNLATFDSLIVKKRMDMNQTEGMLGTPPLKLISQLEKNPQNKAAFECLIAFDLMEHDVISLIEDFKYINKFNYNKLPVALEEAVILYRSQGKNSAFFNRFRISESTTKRFQEFAKLTSAAKGDREKAKQATQAFKKTYWYYVLFISPKVTNLKLDTKPVEANY
jgi:hypothetical protein